MLMMIDASLVERLKCSLHVRGTGVRGNGRGKGGGKWGGRKEERGRGKRTRWLGEGAGDDDGKRTSQMGGVRVVRRGEAYW